MTHGIRVATLLVAATLVMCAAIAPSAFAIDFHVDSRTGNSFVTNTTTTGTSHKFDAAGNTITCTTASFSGTIFGNTSPSIFELWQYGNCTFFGVAVTVNMNNCGYELKANGEVAIADAPGKDCNSGKITFKASFLGVSCHVEIGEQSGLKSVSYDGSTTANGSITGTPAISGITYTATGSGCGETGTKSNGNYTTGTSKWTCYVDEGGVEKESTPCWWS